MAGAHTIHYSILRAVQRYQRATCTATDGRGSGATMDYIDARIPGEDFPHLQRAVIQLCAARWMDGPWLAKEYGRYYLTSAGWNALEDAESSPALPQIGGWVDRMRWPWRERDSRTQNVAIPTGGTIQGTTIRSPELRAIFQSLRLLTDRQDREDGEDYKF